LSKVRDPYSALADPTRRTILEALRDSETLTAGQIAGRFPEVSRAAVSKHLKVLRDVRLVSARERGREWHYQLRPQRLSEVEAWLHGFAPYWADSLKRLKQLSEDTPEAALDSPVEPLREETP
jgi:DNA-binding transcriptional ArsR family regulator